MARVLTVTLSILLAALQYRLWVAEGGIAHTHRLGQAVAEQREGIERLRHRNAALEAEIASLKTGLDAIESRARLSLGMVRRGETFFLIPDAG